EKPRQGEGGVRDLRVEPDQAGFLDARRTNHRRLVEGSRKAGALPETQRHEHRVPARRQRESRVARNRQLFSVGVDGVTGLADDPPGAGVGRALEADSQAGNDSSPQQLAVVTAQLLAVIVLLVGKRRGIEELAPEEDRPGEPAAALPTGTGERPQRRRRTPGG